MVINWQPDSTKETSVEKVIPEVCELALSGWLEKNGTPATRIDTEAACTVEPDTEGFKISTIKLDVRVNAPGLDDAKFQELAVATKNSCPVSKSFAGNVDIQMDAKLV